MRLSKDRHLEEREQLQFQVSDLNHKIQEQHETIQVNLILFTCCFLFNSSMNLLRICIEDWPSKEKV